jgi:hypothetical protein
MWANSIRKAAPCWLRATLPARPRWPCTADLGRTEAGRPRWRADFLVTSLDEALRILKNEIRKREAVAVCVAAAPRPWRCEMLERGVLPDLLRPADESSAHSPFVAGSTAD